MYVYIGDAPSSVDHCRSNHHKSSSRIFIEILYLLNQMDPVHWILWRTKLHTEMKQQAIGRFLKNWEKREKKKPLYGRARSKHRFIVLFHSSLTLFSLIKLIYFSYYDVLIENPNVSNRNSICALNVSDFVHLRKLLLLQDNLMISEWDQMWSWI